MMNAKEQLLVKVLDSTRMGFTGVVTGRLLRKSDAEALVQKGLLERQPMVVCDGDGWAIQPERWRDGYALTPSGKVAAVALADAKEQVWPCRHCGNAMQVSPRSYEENPFCSGCLHQGFAPHVLTGHDLLGDA